MDGGRRAYLDSSSNYNTIFAKCFICQRFAVEENNKMRCSSARIRK